MISGEQGENVECHKGKRERTESPRQCMCTHVGSSKTDGFNIALLSWVTNTPPSSHGSHLFLNGNNNKITDLTLSNAAMVQKHESEAWILRDPCNFYNSSKNHHQNISHLVYIGVFCDFLVVLLSFSIKTMNTCEALCFGTMLLRSSETPDLWF